MNRANLLGATARVAGTGGDPALGRVVLRDGQQVAFTVLKSLGPGEYLIAVGQQRLSASTGVNLAEGGRHLAQVAVRNGEVLLLIKPSADGLLSRLLPDPQLFLQPLRALFARWPAGSPLPPGFAANCLTPEGVKEALANCGMFYEARIKEALRKGQPFDFLRDFKGFLLQQVSGKGEAGARSFPALLLKNLEFQQLASAQDRLDGPAFFWLPFLDETLVEGFARRVPGADPGGPGLLLVWRVPFVEKEEVLVTLLWSTRRLEIHFTTGSRLGDLLRGEISGLEERLRAGGFTRLTLQVSERPPAHLQESMKGAHFTEVYG